MLSCFYSEADGYDYRRAQMWASHMNPEVRKVGIRATRLLNAGGAFLCLAIALAIIALILVIVASGDLKNKLITPIACLIGATVLSLIVAFVCRYIHESSDRRPLLQKISRDYESAYLSEVALQHKPIGGAIEMQPDRSGAEG